MNVERDGKDMRAMHASSGVARKSVPFGAPVFDEREIQAVTEVLRGPILTHGPWGEKFEALFAEFSGVKHAVALSSCTAGLHLSMMALGLGPGDEVIVPAQTHTATAHAPELCGARAVFADVDSATGNISVDEIERRITDRTRAIAVVHFLGLPCDMDAIMDLASRRGLPVIEDCALAVGTQYRGRAAGSIGLTGNFSFYPIKHIATGEGGMLTTNDDRVAGLVKKQRAFGIDRDVSQRSIPGVYDVKYLGNNYRMTEMQAALGVVQMQKQAEMMEKRRHNAAVLGAQLAAIPGIRLFRAPLTHETHSHYCLSIMLEKNPDLSRDRVILALKDRGIGASIYYATPIPLMGYYREKYGYRRGDFPNAEFIADQTISLPVGAHLQPGDVEYVAESVANVLTQL